MLSKTNMSALVRTATCSIPVQRRMVFCTGLLALTFSFACKTDQADPIFTQQLLFESGEVGYHTYRIPALITTKKGALLAFCEGRAPSTREPLFRWKTVAPWWTGCPPEAWNGPTSF